MMCSSFLAIMLSFCMTLSSSPTMTNAQIMQTGVFVVKDPGTLKCPNKKKLMNSLSTHCLEKAPLITVDYFAAVGDIQYSEKKRHRQFMISFKPEGSQMLNSLARMSPESQIAVVVDGRLISVISIHQPFNSRLITLWDQSDNQYFTAIHQDLQNMVNKNQ